jgi:hypothetical protein
MRCDCLASPKSGRGLATEPELGMRCDTSRVLAGEMVEILATEPELGMRCDCCEQSP